MRPGVCLSGGKICQARRPRGSPHALPQKIKRGPDCSGPLLRADLFEAALAAAEQPFPAQAVFQGGDAEKRGNGAVTDHGLRSNWGYGRKQIRGGSEEAEGNREDDFGIHVWYVFVGLSIPTRREYHERFNS